MKIRRRRIRKDLWRQLAKDGDPVAEGEPTNAPVGLFVTSLPEQRLEGVVYCIGLGDGNPRSGRETDRLFNGVCTRLEAAAQLFFIAAQMQRLRRSATLASCA